MKNETDILIKISELELSISNFEKEYPTGSPFFQEGNDSIIIANEKIEILKWVLEK